jgi:hypothetical protein
MSLGRTCQLYVRAGLPEHGRGGGGGGAPEKPQMAAPPGTTEAEPEAGRPTPTRTGLGRFSHAPARAKGSERGRMRAVAVSARRPCVSPRAAARKA